MPHIADARLASCFLSPPEMCWYLNMYITSRLCSLASLSAGQLFPQDGDTTWNVLPPPSKKCYLK